MKIKVILIITFLTLLFINISSFIKITSTIDVELNSTESINRYFLYYTTEENTNFNEQQVESFWVTPDAEMIKKIFTINNIDNIQKLRIDFGPNGNENIGTQITIGGLNISGKTNKSIGSTDLINYYVKDCDIEIIDDKAIVTITGSDPLIIIDDVNVQAKRNIVIDYYGIIIYSTVILLTLSIVYRLMINNKTVENKLNVIFLLVLAVIIVLPIILVDNNEIDEVENRTLEEMPYLRNEDGSYNTKFTSQYEDWLNDHFGFRRAFLNLNTKLTTMFQKNRIENDNYMLGKDGWMFTKLNNSVENYIGLNLYTEEELDEILAVVKEREAWLNSQGIAYYIMVGPDKRSVYGEYYPEYYKQVSDITRTEQLIEKLEENEINIVYPKDELVSSKDVYDAPLYYKEDTHWNYLGGLIGAQSLIDEMRKEFPELGEVDYDDYKWKVVEPKLYDIANALNVEPDMSSIYLRPDDKYFDNYSEKTYFYDDSRELEEEFIYNQDGELSVYLFADSFRNSMKIYLADVFKYMHIIRYNGPSTGSIEFGKIQDDIIEEKPDAVVQLFVERGFPNEIGRNEVKLKSIN